jgi:hypothetical protein
MVDVVLVHGIAKEQASADSLESTWIPALAGGVRIAGFPDLADNIWKSKAHRAINCRMVFYGDLFLRPGTQGVGGVGQFGEILFTEQIAIEWLMRAAERSSRPEDRAQAEMALGPLRSNFSEDSWVRQGFGERIRPIVRTLARRKHFSNYGMAFSEKLVLRSLRQVTQYFTDPSTRNQAIDRFLNIYDETTKIVIAHSLGSAVAFEALQKVDRELELFLTLGSPLGIDTVGYKRLQPQPPVFPECVNNWCNVIDPDDLIALEPDLASGFLSTTGRQVSTVRVDNGSKPHDATRYLAKREVGKVVAGTLRDSTW